MNDELLKQRIGSEVSKNDLRQIADLLRAVGDINQFDHESFSQTVEDAAADPGGPNIIPNQSVVLYRDKFYLYRGQEGSSIRIGDSIVLPPNTSIRTFPQLNRPRERQQKRI